MLYCVVITVKKVTGAAFPLNHATDVKKRDHKII